MGASLSFVNGLDFHNQTAVFAHSPALGASRPRVVAAGRHLKRSAHLPHLIPPAVVAHGQISYLGTREKMSTAFLICRVPGATPRFPREVSQALHPGVSSAPFPERPPPDHQRTAFSSVQHAFADPKVTRRPGYAKPFIRDQGHRLQLELPGETPSFPCHATPSRTLYVRLKVSFKSGELH